MSISSDYDDFDDVNSISFEQPIELTKSINTDLTNQIEKTKPLLIATLSNVQSGIQSLSKREINVDKEGGILHWLHFLWELVKPEPLH